MCPMCPMCKSIHIFPENPEANGNVVTQTVVCTTCDSNWTDIWELKRFDNLNEDNTLAQHQAIYKKACEVEEINLKQYTKKV